ncbi:MAG: hypothetical protein ABSG43_27950, partial [Solirubrobacteraceae bacterium]
VHGSLQIAEDSVVDGGISLRAASIGGALDCTAATLVAGSNGYALYADRMRVGADLFFAGGFLAKGQILLEFAVVHGDFDCRQGTIEHEHRTALDAAQLTVKGDVLCCDTFFSKGTATFVGAAVDGKIDFTDARLVNGTALALSLERVAVRGNLSLKAATIDGGVDLRFASVGAFEDHARVQPTEVLIEGFTYRSIDGRDVNERLKWLDEYSKNSPQPYEQLARAYHIGNRDAKKMPVRPRFESDGKGGRSGTLQVGCGTVRWTGGSAMATTPGGCSCGSLRS